MEVNAMESHIPVLKEALTKLELKPGDKLVLNVDSHITEHAQARMREVIEEWSGGVPVLVLTKGMELSVLAKGGSAEPNDAVDVTSLHSQWREYAPAYKVEAKTETLQVAHVNAVAGNLEIVNDGPLCHKILLDGKEVQHCTDLTLWMAAGRLPELTMTTALIKDEPKSDGDYWTKRACIHAERQAEEPKESWREQPPLL